MLLYVGLALFYSFREPVLSVNYLHVLNANAEKVAANDRAWPLYREAAIQLDLDGQNKTNSPFDQIMQWIGGKRASLTPESQAWLKKHAGALDLIRAGAAKAGLGYVLRAGRGPEDDLLDPGKDAAAEQAPIVTDPYAKNEPVINVRLPYSEPMLLMARLLGVDAVVAAEQNDTARMNADLLAIDGMARHCYESPLIINAMSGHAIRFIGLDTFALLLTRHPERFSDASLQEMARRISGWDFRERMLNAFAGERSFFADLVQRTYTDDGHGNGSITKQGLELIRRLFSGDPPNQFVRTVGFLGKELGLKTQHESAVMSTVMTLAIPAAREMIADRYEVMQKYDQVMRYSEARLRANQRDLPQDDPNDPWQEIRKNKTHHLLISVAGPALDVFGKINETHEVARDGVLLGIALTLYHRKEGRYPETLAELSPRFIATIPVDPMNGEPLHYRVTENGPVVYGVGTNLKDDGGVQTPKARHACQWRYSEPLRNSPEYQGDWILWPMPRD